MNDLSFSNTAARRAKVVLWLAVGVLVVSQFLTVSPLNFGKGWWFFMMAEGYHLLISGFSNSSEYIGVYAIAEGLLTLFLLSLLVCPWLVDFLKKARSLLWILRLMISVPAGLAAWAFLWEGVVEGGTPFFHGLVWAVMAVVLNAIGLWMIPKAVKRQALMAQEIPTTDEHE